MIAENLNKIEDKIAESCIRCSRNRSEIRLIAVSKTQPISVINEVLEAGIKDLGENKAQELRDKSELIAGNFSWHYIGLLQTYKILPSATVLFETIILNNEKKMTIDCDYLISKYKNCPLRAHRYETGAE